MYKQSFGTKNQIQFSNEHEYYELLGYLSKTDGSTNLTWEDNDEQGAWGKEGRIEFFVDNPNFLATLMHSAGNGGKIISRVNCNEFIHNIVTNYGFVVREQQNYSTIRNIIPQQYLLDFDRGFNL
jgi:hypothetical protein